MKLKKLVLHRLPGFEHKGFELTDIHPGLNVIIGPNASGKTSICQAVRRLLWPEKVKHFISAIIHSEWSCNEETFTIGVKDGTLTPCVSQGGKTLLDRLPDEHLVPCFSMTIDELFDSKDSEFAASISKEIAGGYDIEAAQKKFLFPSASRGAVLDWEKAKMRLQEYGQEQQKLRLEGEGLPLLEQKIKEAEESRLKCAILEKVIKLKSIKNKISLREATLGAFPRQIIQSTIKVTDWNTYEKLVEKCKLLNEEVTSLQEETKKIELHIGKWRDVLLPEGELDQRLDLIESIRRNVHEKIEIISKIVKLKSDIAEHRRLLGILSDEDIEKINAEALDRFSEKWEVLDQLNSKIIGIRAQIHLNDAKDKAFVENYGQASELLSELASISRANVNDFWIVTSITLLFSALSLFLLPDWTRVCALTSCIPLGFMWLGIFRNTERKKQIKIRCNELGVSLPKDESFSAIFEQLNRTIIEWGNARQIDSQLQRKKDLESLLELEINQQKVLRDALAKQAIAAGITSLPDSRYVFAKYVKNLHENWMELKKASLDLKRISDALDVEWEEWYAFTSLFEEKRSTHVSELGKILNRIKKRIDDRADLNKRVVELKKRQEKLRICESEIEQLLIKTECLGDPAKLKTLVEQLSDYHEVQGDLKNLKSQFEELSLELGDKNTARIHDDIEPLENEKKNEEERAKTLQFFSESKGNLEARMKQAETAAEGEKLLSEQNQHFEKVRAACRDFAKKELLELLVSEAQKDFQRSCQPPVLERAVDWFQRFTKNKFKLEAPFTHTGSIVYEVVDTSTGERRTLEQLSRGTRMQLLLSVRLAFAFESEGKGFRLPIFLDEVLANTDKERFGAVAEVVGELVNEGRQIFYLTCNPEDAWKWKKSCSSAHCIDLAEIRGQEAVRFDPAIAQVESRFPKPSGQSVARYAEELKLPAIRIDCPVHMVSIHYLVDNVVDLHRLLMCGIETYGNFMSVKSIEKGFPDSAALMERRGYLLERFFDLKTRGRGKAVSRDDLVKGGLSKTFIDRIWELAQQLNCNAKSLIEFLEDKTKKDERKKGLSESSKESVKEYLIQNKNLDTRAILTDEEIRLELLPQTIDEQDRDFVEKLIRP